MKHGVKCNLCQKYSAVGNLIDHKTLCDRCYEIVKRSLIGRSFRPNTMLRHIRSAMRDLERGT